jgi:hypothetical protein
MSKLARMSMRHRCTIQRNLSDGTESDDWGQDALPDWATIATDVPCRAWYERVGTQTIQDGEKLAELTVRRLMLPYTTDLDEDDRIVNVTDRLGRELFDGPMRIDTLDRREGHMIASLTDVR